MAAPNSTTRSKKPVGHDRAGRVVRVVDEQQLRARSRVVGVDRVEVGDEAELGHERHQHRGGAGEQRPAGVDRVAGVGGERDVVGVEEREVEVEDALLRADRRHHLAVGVERRRRSGARRSSRPPRGTPRGRGWTGTGASSGSATARCAASTIGAERRRVGVADAERDHVDAGGALLRRSCARAGRTGTAGCARGAHWVSSSSLRKSSASVPAIHGHRPAGQGHVQVLPDVDVSSPPSRRTTISAAPPRRT